MSSRFLWNMVTNTVNMELKLVSTIKGNSKQRKLNSNKRKTNSEYNFKLNLNYTSDRAVKATSVNLRQVCQFDLHKARLARDATRPINLV